MNNKSLLTIIIVILAGIFAVVSIQANQETPAEKVSKSVIELTKKVGEEISE